MSFCVNMEEVGFEAFHLSDGFRGSNSAELLVRTGFVRSEQAWQFFHGLHMEHMEAPRDNYDCNKCCTNKVKLNGKCTKDPNGSVLHLVDVCGGSQTADFSFQWNSWRLWLHCWHCFTAFNHHAFIDNSQILQKSMDSNIRITLHVITKRLQMPNELCQRSLSNSNHLSSVGTCQNEKESLDNGFHHHPLPVSLITPALVPLAALAHALENDAALCCRSQQSGSAQLWFSPAFTVYGYFCNM